MKSKRSDKSYTVEFRSRIILLLLMLIPWSVISCYEQSSEVSIRHFYVTYTIDDNGTTADITAQLRIIDASGDEIELDDGDSISVNGNLLDDDSSTDELVYSVSCTSSDEYTFQFTKADEVHTDVVDMPVELDSLTIPSSINSNEAFSVDWGNYEAGSIVELYFYQGDESKYCSIADDSSTVYNGDNSAWLAGFDPGTVSMTACRTRNYSINRSFGGGDIVVRGPRTTAVNVTLN